MELTFMAKTAAISIRVEPELKAALEQLAREDRRPLASLVEKVLADFVEAKKSRNS
jgi:predicted transcriptional regulator